jgi:hypothetical protein
MYQHMQEDDLPSQYRGDEVWRLGLSDSEEGKALRIEDVPGGRREVAVRI